jgi:spoIIIJ-associated protein
MTQEPDVRSEESPEQSSQLGEADVFKAVRVVREIFDLMGLDVVISTGPPGSKLINVSGPDSGLVVGKRGHTLDALHFLLNRMMHRATGKKGFIDLDVEGYRSRREDALKAQAVELARQARTEGKVLSFDPMNARERRIVHLALVDEPGVHTESEGSGEDRRVQVFPDEPEDD